jgi:hypothetical protein
MNDDLILRARLDALGYSDEYIQKNVIGQSSLPGSRRGSIPVFGAALHRKKMGMSKDDYKQQVRDNKTTGQQTARNEMFDANAAKGNINTAPQTVPAMTEPSIKNADGTTQSLQEVGMQQAGIGNDDGSVTGTGTPDQVKTDTKMGADGNPAQTTTTEVHNANADTTGPSGAGNVTDTTQQQQPDQQQPQQQPQAQGQGGVNAQVQGMAQQFQAGQDMQTVQQGKGAADQTWAKNRSGMGKFFDVATFGATAGLGKTGAGGRRQANEQSQQQTKNYNQAQQRNNQRAMGMGASMPIATSFDSQLSAYSDVLSLRKQIQERTTTHNLRR